MAEMVVGNGGGTELIITKVAGVWWHDVGAMFCKSLPVGSKFVVEGQTYVMKGFSGQLLFKKF